MVDVPWTRGGEQWLNYIMIPRICTFIYLCLPLFRKGFKAVYVHTLYLKNVFGMSNKKARQEGMRVSNKWEAKKRNRHSAQADSY